MDSKFFQFVIQTNLENFSSSQETIFLHAEYNPYSSDLKELEDLVNQGKFEAASEYQSVNTLLSPRAHIFKSFAWHKLGKEQEEKAEIILAHKIQEGLLLTGDGSQEKPYVVTRISDERDMLESMQEVYSMQALVKEENRFLDRITTESGRSIYFDITRPYNRIQHLLNSGEVTMPFGAEAKKSGGTSAESDKKWWQFWK